MDQAELVRAQRAEEPIAALAAHRKFEQGRPTFLASEQLLRKAQKTPRAGKRIRLILEAADAWAAQVAPLAACRRGCDACCLLPVAITSAEARVIAAATGRPMIIPTGARKISEAVADPVEIERLATYNGRAPGPCPLLQDGQCSAYDARPAACRTHFSMADTSLLCQVVDGAPADVPYADSRQFQAFAMAMQLNETLADIRDFFSLTSHNCEQSASA